METLIYVPGVAAALSIVFVTQATYFIPSMTIMAQKTLAIFILFFVMGINVLSTKLGSKVQVIATIGKLVPIFVIVIFGLLKGTAHDFAVPAVASNSVGATGFGAAILGTLWAYDGWINVGNMAGELKNPKKDLPKSIIIGLIATIVVYILINIAIINIMPMTTVITSSKPASDAAVILFGDTGASLIAAGIMVSIFGALNGYLMTGVRIPFAMAQDNIFPFAKFFGKVNEKFETPINAFVLWIFFVMCVAGIFILRSKHKHLERSYKVPFYPIVPLIGIVGGVYILVSTFITDSSNSIYGIVITLLGFPVYLYINKRNKRI